MLIKAFGRFKPNGKPEPVAPAPGVAGPQSGGLPRMISTAGRISLNLLQRVVQTVSREDFLHFMQQPALAGSAVYLGTLSAARPESGSRQMNRTILFEPVEDAEETASASESLRHAIYPLVRGEFATSTGIAFTIGRIDGNDFIMPDYAISKKHAVIEIKRGSYLLSDCGSTNGTMLNGKRVGSKPLALHDRDLISFARYEFSFLFPDSLYDMLKMA
jgi:hypothetical protein